MTDPVLLTDVDLPPVLSHAEFVLLADRGDFLVAVVVPGLGEAGEGKAGEDDEGEERQAEEGERSPAERDGEGGAVPN